MKPVFASRHLGCALLLAGLFGPLQAADLALPFTGDLRGRVLDSAGTPQMGASVEVLNKYQRLIASTFSAPDGRFSVPDLPIDTYSVRVSLASFLPVSRDKVAVRAGVDGFLEIHLATLFSSIELSYKAPEGAMSDDWKWVLRSSPATRLITRLTPDESSASTKLRPSIFSGTHAVLAFSGGDGGFVDADQMSADLDTGFALSTNLFGKNRVQVAGTFGQSADPGPPALALCAIYSRPESSLFGSAPEVTLSVAQVGGISAQPGSFGQGGAPGNLGLASAPLRTMSLGFYETADLLDFMHLEYGAIGESIDYEQHRNRVTPFARLTADGGKGGQVVLAYSDGSRPDQLLSHRNSSTTTDGAVTEENLSPALDFLSRFPQVSNSGGELKLQRTQNYEGGYSKSIGSRTYSATAYYENVSNGRVNVAGDLTGLDSADLLSYSFATTSTYNIGRYARTGYFGSIAQNLTEDSNLAFSYGRTGAFTADGSGSISDSSNFLHRGSHNIASVSIKTVVHRSGTRVVANYGWMDPHTLMPRHMFLTQEINVTPGMNVMVRQPLPSLFGLPGRLELTADMRNVLAGGYMPLINGNGHRLLLVDAPRSVRGGLKFTF